MKRAYFATALKNNVALLRDLVNAVPPAGLDRRVKDYWTLREHLEHLVLTQKMLLGRLEQFKTEARPVMKPYVPETAPPATASAQALLDEYEAVREKQLAIVEAADEAIWAKRAEHAEYREYGFEILVRHIVLHDSFHMARMEELWFVKEEFVTAM